MPSLSIKNVPEDIVDRLRKRAAANHRSLQGELLVLVTQVFKPDPSADLSDRPAAPEQRGMGYKSIEQIAAEHRERRERPVTGGGRSVELIRADRDAR